MRSAGLTSSSTCAMGFARTPFWWRVPFRSMSSKLPHARRIDEHATDQRAQRAPIQQAERPASGHSNSSHFRCSLPGQNRR
eukprot:6192909-Pleurochrysis_carterae.AAC.4